MSYASVSSRGRKVWWAQTGIKNWPANQLYACCVMTETLRLKVLKQRQPSPVTSWWRIYIICWCKDRKHLPRKSDVSLPSGRPTCWSGKQKPVSEKCFVLKRKSIYALTKAPSASYLTLTSAYFKRSVRYQRYEDLSEQTFSLHWLICRGLLFWIVYLLFAMYILVCSSLHILIKGSTNWSNKVCAV